MYIPIVKLFIRYVNYEEKIISNYFYVFGIAIIFDGS
jgi:hypothetical protein